MCGRLRNVELNSGKILLKGMISENEFQKVHISETG